MAKSIKVKMLQIGKLIPVVNTHINCHLRLAYTVKEVVCFPMWISKKLGVDIYFTDSYASWQKGNIENTNKLIRQYIPKGTDFKNINNNRIMQIQKKINRRPREKLGFNSPKYEFYKHFS